MTNYLVNEYKILNRAIGDLVTAYHEIGHAIVTQVYGIGFIRVDIIQAESRSGICERKAIPLKYCNKSVLIIDAITALSGRISENIIRDKIGLIKDYSHSDEDQRQANRNIYALTKHKVNAAYFLYISEAVEKKAEEIIRNNWEVIKDLSLILLDRKVITSRANDVKYLLEQVKPETFILDDFLREQP